MAILILFLLSCLVSCDTYLENSQHISGETVVVITFDDAHWTVYERGYQMMKEVDTSWKATHFFTSLTIGLPGFTSLAQVKEMEDFGWESGGHGVTHENLSSVPLDSARWQIEQNYAYLKSNGLHHKSWAYAFGNYNDDVESIVSEYFTYIRNSQDLHYKHGINPKRLGYFAVKKEHSLDDLILRVETAVSNKEPLVIIGFHLILDPEELETPEYFTRTPIFKGFLNYLKEREHIVLPLEEAMKYLSVGEF